MTTRVVIVMGGLAILSALVLGLGSPKAEVAPKNKCTYVLAPGESC